MGQDDGGKAERLAAALRANLRKRKSQQRARDDLSGRDPKRRDTPLHKSGAASGNAPGPGPNDDDKA